MNGGESGAGGYRELTTEEVWAERRRLAALENPALMGRYLDPERFRIRAHTRILGRALARLGPGRVDRLLITTPPQVGKSTIVSELFPFWWLARHPRDQVLIGSYAAELAVKKSRATRQLVREHGHHFGLRLQHGSQASNDWELTTGGGLRAAGVGGSLTGFPGNCCVIDDPHKDRREAESTAMREAVWDWWSSTVLSRLSPGAPVCLIMTRWHCLIEDQPVMTDRGAVPVAQVRAGDLVLTTDGYQKVQAAASRLHDGEVTRLSFYGTPEHLTVTPEHEVLTPDGWRQAGAMTPGDWALVPGRRAESVMTSAEVRGLLPPPPAPRSSPDVPARGTAERLPVTREQLVADVEAGLSYQQIAEKYGRKTRAAAYSWCKLLGVTKPGGNVMAEGALTDPDAWRVIGYWVAEGTLTYGSSKTKSHVCRWSFGEHEQDTLAAETVEVLGRHGLKAGANIRQAGGARKADGNLFDAAGGTCVVTVSSEQLASVLAAFGRGAREKRFPEWTFRLPREYALALLEGWAAGDGCELVNSTARRSEGRWTRIKSASLRLLRDAQALLAQHGVTASVMKSDRGHHEIRWSTSSKPRHLRASSEGVWVKVKRAETRSYSGPVFDLQTPTGDFVAGGVVVHNCSDLAGKLLAQEGAAAEGGRWHVVHLPAFAVSADDPLGRQPGEPLTHPAIPDGDTEALRAHWEVKRQGSTARDWAALYQGDPKPREGALLSAAQIEAQRFFGVEVERLRRAVAVDPSGGGKDTAGLIAGFLGADQRVYVTHDRTKVMPSTQWAREACMLAYETGAQVIYVEKNYGGDLALIPVAGAWDQLQREGLIPEGALKPWIEGKNAKSGKMLRAEPIAQAWLEDRVRMHAYLPEFEDEWGTYSGQVADESPGRIDAAVYLVYGLLQLPGADQHIGNASGVSLQQAGTPQRGGGGGLGSVQLGRMR